MAFTRTYDNFVAYVPIGDAVLFASQSAELRTDGIIRETAVGGSYGPVSAPAGDLPRLPPSGLENRLVEVLVKPSRGDLDTLPDSAIDDVSVQVFYRPCWLFVPGS